MVHQILSPDCRRSVNNTTISAYGHGCLYLQHKPHNFIDAVPYPECRLTGADAIDRATQPLRDCGPSGKEVGEAKPNLSLHPISDLLPLPSIDWTQPESSGQSSPLEAIHTGKTPGA